VPIFVTQTQFFGTEMTRTKPQYLLIEHDRYFYQRKVPLDYPPSQRSPFAARGEGSAKKDDNPLTGRWSGHHRALGWRILWLAGFSWSWNSP